MRSILQPADGPVPLAERVRRGEPVIGALLDATTPASLAAGLDVVCVPADVTLLGARVPGAALVVRVAAVAGAEVAAAFAAGADGVLVTGGSAHDVRAAVEAAAGGLVLVTEDVAVHGPDVAAPAVAVAVRVVGSAGAARSAFAAGARVVLYDLPAMVAELATGLAGARPDAVPLAREPLVLLSGMLGSAALWDGVAERLAEVAMPWPARIDLDDTVAEMAASVLAQAPPRFALAGHSLGAIVALEIVRQAPGRVTRLALVNASGRGPVDAQQAAWSAWRARTERGEFAAVAAELARATLAADRRAEPELVAANEQMAGLVGAGGFLRQLSAQSTRPDSLDSVTAIGVPVVVVSGARDEICPPALQRELVEHCPRAELVTIDGGHMLPLERPAELAGALGAWLVSDA